MLNIANKNVVQTQRDFVDDLSVEAFCGLNPLLSIAAVDVSPFVSLPITFDGTYEARR
jgi:hypothetical protein